LLDGTGVPLQVDFSDHDFGTTLKPHQESSCSLFVSGVPSTLPWERLKTALQHFGPIAEYSKKRSSNCGFFKFETTEAAKSALEFFRDPHVSDHGLSDSDNDSTSDKEWLKEISGTIRVDFAEPPEVREARQRRGAERTTLLQQTQATQDRQKASAKRASHGASSKSQKSKAHVTTNKSSSPPPQLPTPPCVGRNALYPQPPMYYIMSPPIPTFPALGDIYIGNNLSERAVRQLLAGFGPVSLFAAINPGVCVRMVDPMLHQSIVLGLNRTTIPGVPEPINAFLIASLR